MRSSLSRQGPPDADRCEGLARPAAGSGAAEARTLSDRGDEHAALARRVGREELGNRVVVEREAGGTETVRVRAQVETPGDDALCWCESPTGDRRPPNR